MNYFRGALSAVFALFLAGGISAARADVAVIEELTQAQFVTDFGSTTGTFNGITLPASPNNVVSESGGPFTVGSVTYDDQGNDALFVSGPGYNSGSYDIGTGNNILYDNFANNTSPNINMTFAGAVPSIGLIAGDAFGSGGDLAIFNVTFADSTSISGISNDGSNGAGPDLLTIAGGTTPTYFGIFDTDGTAITQLNFSDTAGNPTLDTVTPTPEPTFVGLVSTFMLGMFGVYSIIRKRKNVAARLVSGAAPLTLLAICAVLAVPSRSFAQVDCNIAVPNNPLTAAGLATPYLLSPGDPGCSQAAGTMAFVQAAIYDPNAHTISVYTPLVADAPPSTPGVPRTPRYAISPVVPKLPAGAVVAIWFGYNANNLTLTGSAVAPKNGTPTASQPCFSYFGQFAACNTTNFWNAVNADTTLLTNIYNAFKGQTGNDGQACPGPRSFSIVDQDPNDNLPVNFLLTNESTPRTAQNTAANRAKLAGPLNVPPGTGVGYTVQINPSDEAVVDIFVDGALGCNPPVVADLTDPGTTHASLAVNELFAGLESGQFPAINGTSIYGNGTNPLIGPGFVAIGDTFTLNVPFTQPNAIPNCNTNPATGGCAYPYTGGDLTAFDNYVAAIGYTGQTNPQTISGTLTQGTGTAFNRTMQYRAAVNQPAPNFNSTATPDGSLGDASVQTFCTKMFTRTGVGDNSPADLLFNQDLTYFNQLSNGPGGSNLFQFLGNRFAASYDLLGCAAVFGQANPVNVTNIGNTAPGAPVTPYYPAVFP